MTVLVLGIDALDYEKTTETGCLAGLDPQRLQQDFDGPNALYTWRVWPSIFAGEVGEPGTDPHETYEPDAAYLWESYPSAVYLAPVERPTLSRGQDEFPERYMESFAPPERRDESLDRLQSGINDSLREPGVEVVVGCTRMLDIIGHHEPEMYDEFYGRFQAFLEGLNWDAVDDYVIVSDHGFDHPGEKGLGAHGRGAVLASSFCSYNTMTGFVEGWLDDLAEVVMESHLSDLGYR